MKIKAITITNFRNYLGSNTFNLETDDEHNIILIGGRNGAGKTSMADAMRLCLYGRKYGGIIVSEANYQEYLDEICNKSDGINTLSISMSIVMDEENPPIEVAITRKFIREKSGFKEELILKKGGSEVEFIDEDYWSYYIEKLISPRISRYFFFDGEKVRDIIASSESQSYIQNAINDISGVSELNNLKSDLKEVRKRIISRSSDKGALAKIKDMRENIQSLNGRKELLTEQIDINNSFIEDYTRRRLEYEQERSRLIGSSEEKRKELSDRMSESTTQYDEYNQETIEFCSNRMLYLLAANTIRKTIKLAKSENKALISKYSLDAIASLKDGGRLDELMKFSSANFVIEFLMNELQKDCSDSSSVLLDLTLSRVEQLESLEVSREDVDGFIDAFNRREYYSQEIEKYKDQLRKTSDYSLDDIDSKILEVKTQIEVLGIDNANKQKDVDRIDIDVKSIESQIRKEERNTMLQDIDRVSIDTIDSAMVVIDNRVDVTLTSARLELSKRMNEMYHLLKNTKDMVKKVQLSDSFDIELIDFKDKPINTKYISEGEKGILMYSVMYGLHSLSTMKFPVIIDSPLGRMDTLHVNNLASKLFPTVSSQVVLLSHDREVIGPNHDMIKPYTAKEYLITKFDVPKIKEGYFE